MVCNACQICINDVEKAIFKLAIIIICIHQTFSIYIKVVFYLWQNACKFCGFHDFHYLPVMEQNQMFLLPFKSYFPLKDNHAIFQITSKSKSINSHRNQLKYVLIYGQPIFEREDPVSVMVCVIQKVKHQQFYRNIQISENGFS